MCHLHLRQGISISFSVSENSFSSSTEKSNFQHPDINANLQNDTPSNHYFHLHLWAERGFNWKRVALSGNFENMSVIVKLEILLCHISHKHLFHDASAQLIFMFSWMIYQSSNKFIIILLSLCVRTSKMWSRQYKSCVHFAQYKQCQLCTFLVRQFHHVCLRRVFQMRMPTQ